MGFNVGEKVKWLIKHSIGIGKRIPEINFGIVVEPGESKTLVRESKTKNKRWIKTSNLRHTKIGDVNV